MIVIRANTPDPVLEQTILSLLQQAQIDAEQITFCAKKKLELPGLVIDNTRHEISANGRNISLTRLESDLLWVLAVCEGTHPPQGGGLCRVDREDQALRQISCPDETSVFRAGIVRGVGGLHGRRRHALL